MKPFWKSIRTLLLLGAVLSAITMPIFAGGQGDQIQSSLTVTEGFDGVLRAGKPFAGETINVQLTQWTFGNSLIQQIPDFEEKTGIKVNYDILSPQELFRKQGVELALGQFEADVSEYYPSRHGEMYTSGGWIFPIDEYLNNPMMTDLEALDLADMSIPAREANVIQGKTLGLPYAEANIILIYRKDILEQAGIAAPPDTWDELLVQLETIKQQVPDIIPIIFRGGTGANVNMWHFPSIMYAFGASYFDDNMKPTIDTPEMWKAAEYWKTLVNEYAPTGIVGMGREEPTVYMQTGRVAFSIEGNPRVGVIMHPEQSSVRDKVGFSLIPAGPEGRFANTNTHGMFIPNSSAKKEAAWEFLKWAVSKETTQAVAVEGNHLAVVRSSVISSAEYREKHNYADGLWLEIYPKSLAESKFGAPEVQESDEVADRVGLAITEAATGAKTIERALEDAQKDIEIIMSRSGN
jgi:ABC-type glycerol-3-phosphate transport system substrate-binding protein